MAISSIDLDFECQDIIFVENRYIILDKDSHSFLAELSENTIDITKAKLFTFDECIETVRNSKWRYSVILLDSEEYKEYIPKKNKIFDEKIMNTNMLTPFEFAVIGLLFFSVTLLVGVLFCHQG